MDTTTTADMLKDKLIKLDGGDEPKIHAPKSVIFEAAFQHEEAARAVIDMLNAKDGKVLFVSAIIEDKDGNYLFTFSRNTTIWMAMGLLTQLLSDMAVGADE